MQKVTRDALRQQPSRTSLHNLLAISKRRHEAFIKWKEIDQSEDAKRYRVLRQKQFDLASKKGKLADNEIIELRKLEKALSEPLSAVIAADKERFEQAREEVNQIAKDVAEMVANGFSSEFGIKKTERAAAKVVRWYDVQPNLLGDGSRVNVIVDTVADADFLFGVLNTRFGSKFERTEDTTTELGYPKRLIEIRTSNGKLAEIQVMTPEGYLAKDGVKFFPEDKRQLAQEKLDKVQSRLGWEITDGVGHYFYEIH